jgi:hypothetical protein
MGNTMDLVYLAGIVLFFIAIVGLTVGCKRLGSRS